MNGISPSAVNPVFNQSALTMLWIRTSDCSLVPLEIMQYVSYKILTFNWFCVCIWGEESEGICKMFRVWDYIHWWQQLCKWVMMNTEGRVKVLLFLRVAIACSEKQTNETAQANSAAWNEYPFKIILYNYLWEICSACLKSPKLPFITASWWMT